MMAGRRVDWVKVGIGAFCMAFWLSFAWAVMTVLGGCAEVRDIAVYAVKCGGENSGRSGDCN